MQRKTARDRNTSHPTTCTRGQATLLSTATLAGNLGRFADHGPQRPVPTTWRRKTHLESRAVHHYLFCWCLLCLVAYILFC
jgi:hypothetical protein